jgi:hypothetical protein
VIASRPAILVTQRPSGPTKSAGSSRCGSPTTKSFRIVAGIFRAGRQRTRKRVESRPGEARTVASLGCVQTTVPVGESGSGTLDDHW